MALTLRIRDLDDPPYPRRKDGWQEGCNHERRTDRLRRPALIEPDEQRT